MLDCMLPDGSRFRVDEAVFHGAPGEPQVLRIGLGLEVPAVVAWSDDEDMLDAVARIAHIGGWEFDPRTSRVRWTSETFRILDLTPDNPPLLKHAFDFFVPDDRTRIEVAIRRAIEHGDPFELELQVVTVRGRSMYTRCHCMPVIVDGTTVKLVGTIQEITSQKRTENALKESEVRYRELFENNSAVKLVIDPKTGQIVEANPAAAAFYGYSVNEMLKLQIHDINLAEEALVQGKMEQSRSGESSEFEFRHRLASGEIKDVQVYTGNVTVAGRTLIHSVVVDISERKRAEEKLQRVQQLESLGTLAGGIAHDFNNVLTAIFGNISLAAESVAPNHSAHEFLKSAEHALNRAVGLSHQLLTFSKGGTPTRENVGLQELLSEIVLFDLTGSNIRPVFEFDDDLENVHVDPNQLQQVFSNLALNADQAMPDGGSLHVSACNTQLAEDELAGMDAGNYVMVTFRDEGIGIPPENIHRVFEPYYSSKPTGNGLGLATCYSIIRKHQGSIDLVSQPGHGTTFTILLPAVSMEACQAQEQPRADLPRFSESRHWRVLIMDDDDAILRVLSRMLEKFVTGVVTCRRTEEAVAIYREEQQNRRPFDLTILDLTIPGEPGGKVAVQEILEIDPFAVIACSSGYTDDRVMADYREFGFKAAMAKPYTLDVVRRLIKSLEAQQSEAR